MESEKLHINTYRYKFDDDIVCMMQSFSKIHANDDRETFKEAFDDWKKTHHSVLTKESERLAECGFTGDMYKKMYHSIRYYYRKKSNKKEDVKKRRAYISINKEFLELMDDHIHSLYRMNPIKPAQAYSEFKEKYSEQLGTECMLIQQKNDISKSDTEQKIKKTYKNRYFLFKKSNE